MDFNRKWTAFALEAEEGAFGFTRIADAHNRIAAERDAALSRAAAAEARVAEAERALRNVLLMASRAIAYKSRGGEEDWRHVVRFCADAGVKPSVLRGAAPESEAP